MSDDDPYAHVATGTLKIKGSDVSKVKKNKKKKKKRKVDEIVEHAQESSKGSSSDNEKSMPVRKTAAELAVEKAQEKRAAERILKKASKTHKQRVEELNEYLGDLSEHYDIQKVSWTK